MKIRLGNSIKWGNSKAGWRIDISNPVCVELFKVVVTENQVDSPPFVKLAPGGTGKSHMKIQTARNRQFIGGIDLGCVQVKGEMPPDQNSIVFLQDFLSDERSQVTPKNVKIAMTPKVIGPKVFRKNLAVTWFEDA